MDFSEALNLLKAGHRLGHIQWDTNMFVVLQKGYPHGIAINQNTAEATGLPQGSVHAFRPYLMMHCANGDFVPYVATQTDLLGEGWVDVTPADMMPPKGDPFDD